jgi:hypothetical protein
MAGDRGSEDAQDDRRCGESDSACDAFLEVSRGKRGVDACAHRTA